MGGKNGWYCEKTHMIFFFWYSRVFENLSKKPANTSVGHSAGTNSSDAAQWLELADDEHFLRMVGGPRCFPISGWFNSDQSVYI
jgi:hypothetical protein